jgi:iron complex outermembrane receptor protein
LSRSGSGLRRLGALVVVLCALGRTRAAEPSVDLDEFVVPVPRAETAAGPTAASTVIEAAPYAGEAKSTAEILATAPGVAVQQYGGLGKMATVSIRGSSADQVQVLLDGMPLSTGAGGGVDLTSIPSAWISRIEVVRGAEGAHYGAGALGGAVNVVTRPAAAGSWSALATAGTFRTGTLAADAAVGDADRWAVMAAVSADGTTGRFSYLDQPLSQGGLTVERERDHNGSRLVGGLVKAWTLLGPGRADLLLEASGGRRDLPGWPRYPTPTDSQDDARASGRLRYSMPAGEGLVLSADLFARFDRLALRLRELGSSTTLQRDLESSASAALAWVHGSGTFTASGSAGGERISSSGVGIHSRAILSASLSEELDLAGGALRISPALRVDRTGPFGGLSGKLGAGLRLWGPLSLRASLGRTFRAPSFVELFLQQGVLEPNPDLQPETAWSGDAALVLAGTLGQASAGTFVSLYRDLIVYQAAAFRRVKPQNADRALVRGIELEAASTPQPQLLGASLTLAYTYMATEALRGSEDVLGKDLPRKPRHRLYGRLGFERGPVQAHLEAQWVASQWQDEQNLQPIPQATVVGAGAGLRVWRDPEVALSAELKNLLDDRKLQDGFDDPLPGRMVLFTLRIGSPTENQPL